MKTTARFGFAILCLGLLVSASPPLRAQSSSNTAEAASGSDVSRRVEELEKLVEKLQGELAAVKKQLATEPSAASTPAAPPPATPAPAAATASAAATSGSGFAPSSEAESSAPSASGAVAQILGKTTLSGFVDGYYGYNFNHPQGQVTPFRAFDGPTNQFSLNMIELILDRPAEASNSRLGYRLSFGYGNAMNVVNSTDPGGLGFAQYLKEGYVTYLAPVGKGLQVDFGKFVTPHGAEVIETRDNWNYSRGLLFTWAIPFYHFGMRAKYAFNDKVAVTGYLVNGWNSVVDNNTGKTVGVALAWNPTKKIGIIQNYMAGPEQAGVNSNWRQLSDTVVTLAATDRLSLIFNYDYGHDRVAGLNTPVNWSGVAGYIRYALGDRNALITRYEYYNDTDGFTTGTAQHLQEVTGTFEHVIAKHLLTRLEYRHDFSNRPTYLKGNAPMTGQDTVAAGMVYSFDCKETD